MKKMFLVISIILCGAMNIWSVSAQAFFHHGHSSEEEFYFPRGQRFTTDTMDLIKRDVDMDFRNGSIVRSGAIIESTGRRIQVDPEGTKVAQVRVIYSPTFDRYPTAPEGMVGWMRVNTLRFSR